jgi:hypothetical protein
MYERSREVAEALSAGRRALAVLEEAEESLDSAKRWGVWDILGGGLISSAVKHARLSDARRDLAAAREELAAFSRELGDVREIHGFDLGISDLAALFDIAFDNVLTDLLVQSQIDDAADRVEETTRRVRVAVDKLETLR